MKTLRTPADLVAAKLAEPERLADLERVAARYAVAITPDIAGLIDPEDPNDPIARQFVPTVGELDTRPEELADPIGDEPHSPVPGLVHRYPDRVLLKAVQVCPVYCRFCFRRETVGPQHGNLLPNDQIAAAMDYVAAHPEIWEVILTGGDPLVLSARRLSALLAPLAAMEHVRVVRLHTRVPVVMPASVTDELAAALRLPGKATWVAVHANHPREMTTEARAACARLVDAGIPLVSQTVLLKDVNDDPDILGALMRAFVETRIKPYYLHHGDLAPGTAAFRTTIGAGQALARALRGHYSGLCQPTYVLDIPGGAGKSPIGPAYLAEEPEGFSVEDWRGQRHRYPPSEPGEPERG